MTYDSAALRDLFASPFDAASWTGVLADLFGVRHDPKADLASRLRPLAPTASGDKGFHLGSFTTSNGYLVGLFRYEISSGSVLRRKVGLRALVKPFLGLDYDAALVVFADRGSPIWRFSFVCDIKGEATAPKRFTYVFGDPATPHRTPVERFLALQDSREPQRPVSFEAMQTAFSVEALSDQFFKEYKEHYEDFVSHVTGKRFVKQAGKWVETVVGRPHRTLYATFGRNDKRVRDYVKKLLGRLVFLHFLQKKGWLGASAGTWADGDRAFLLHLFEKSSPEQKDDFLDGVLERLFFNALNTDRTSQDDFFVTGVSGIGKCRIPYLNGGLFERDDLDKLRVKFPAEFFERLLKFFAEYNFTIDENDPDEAEVGIDPEMLGRIFENLLEDNKDKGAFYTPKEIVGYMCRRSLLAYLSEGRPEKEAAVIEAFLDTRDPAPLPPVLARDLDDRLRDVKICDPAIGSGAFPMGLLRELFALRLALAAHNQPPSGRGRARSAGGSTPCAVSAPAALKREIIENNIYGVDIEKGAVDIARLRFWLSLVVDEEEPSPLPNLDFKIMQGNSLIESWQGVDLSHLAEKKTRSSKKRSKDDWQLSSPAYQLTFFENFADVQNKKLRDLLHKWYSCADHHERANLRRDIRSAAEEQVKSILPDFSFGTIDPSANTDFFLWHLWFSEVFDKGGFDIVIGNPPYISAIEYSKLVSEEEKQLLCKSFKAAKGAWDLYVLFFERGIQLLKNGGTLAFITPNKYLSATYGKALRSLFIENINLRNIVDLSRISVFETASVYPIITILSQTPQAQYITVCKPISSALLSGNMKSVEIESSVMSACPDNVWGVLLSDELNKLSTVLANSVRLDSIAQVNATSTAAEADEYGKLIKEQPSRKEGFLKLVNTGTIDPYLSLWGQKPLTHQHHRFLSPKLPINSKEINCRRRSLYQEPKIIFAKIGIRAEAFLDETGEYASLNTNCVYKPLEGFSLTYLLGVFNSSAFTTIYELLFGSLRMSGGYMQFQSPQLRIMPIPKATPAQQSAIASLVTRILSAKASDPSADTSALESQIDSLVYRLYGLTDEEVTIVEGNGRSDDEPQRKDSPHPASPHKRGKPAAEKSMDDEVLE